MVTNKQRKKRLIIMFTLTFLYMIAEMVVGCWGNSTTLLTDAFHMLSDVIALVVGFTSIHLSPKKWDKNTFGWARAEVLGALVNAVFLLALCFTIVMDSVQKFVNPTPLEKVELILIVGFGGLVMNIIGLCVFHEGSGHSHDGSQKPHHRARVQANEALPADQNVKLRPLKRGSMIQNQNRLTRIIVPEESFTYTNTSNSTNATVAPSVISVSEIASQPEINDEHTVENVGERKRRPHPHISHPPKKKNLNMRSVFLHIMADTANSVVVMVAGGVCYTVEQYIGPTYISQPKWKWVLYLDPILSVIIVSLICLSTWPLIQETSEILLQNVPKHMSMKLMEAELLSEVKGISGIHEFHVWQLAGDDFVASIHLKCLDVNDYDRISMEVKAFFYRHGIKETTVQAEIQSSTKPPPERSSVCLVRVDEPSLT